MSDQELYDKARLVNAALMAKIHTVDWTPAIIAHPTTVLALRTNWYGLLGEHLARPVRDASPTTRCCTASPARRRTTTACPTR